MRKSLVTIGFSSHRVEALPYAQEQMAAHGLIILEEPPSQNLRLMLQGHLAISDYMNEQNSAFPEYGMRMCALMQDLYRSGKRVSQVEPYLERLLQIYEDFRGGKSPDEVVKTPALREVYLAEKRASQALIGFYTSSIKDPFEKVVKSVKAFAQADAFRLNLRARLRAKAIASLATPGDSVYVEAGYMHYPLYHYLRREHLNPMSIRVVFLLTPVIKKLRGRRRNLGPGDALTLRYAFHDKLGHDLSNLLAARSLIYVKLIQKEELIPGLSEAPHSVDEVRVNRLVDRLQFADCQALYHRMRLANPEQALRLVKSYLDSNHPDISEWGEH
jgi:hypothetical protein